MAYGEKFKLEFSDLRGNKRKLSILKKNYTGSVSDLVGTGDPVVIKWDADDDFYSPIIGSSCELNLFVTDDTNYDNWYDADEREYKVQVATGTTFGAKIWDLQNDNFADANFLWNEGTDGYEFYWEGFLVVDRYQEAVLTKPYPIKLIASDGLGLLKGFDAPLSKLNTSINPLSQQEEANDFTGADANSNFDNLFYYIVEILKLTGLDFDIRIANNIRAAGFDPEKTLFHDIEAYEFGVLGNNFKTLSAKKLLTKILEFTNSRIFQSNGSWYIISNTNIVDKRLLIETTTVDDVDTTEIVPFAEDLFLTTRVDTPTESTNFVANDAANNSLTFTITQQPFFGSLTTTSTSFVYTPPSGYNGDEIFKFKASNSTTDSGVATVRIYTYPEPTAVVGSASVQLYQGVNLQDAIAAAVGGTTTNLRTLIVSAQQKQFQSYNDVEWFQVQDNVRTQSISFGLRDKTLNGFFALPAYYSYQAIFNQSGDQPYALAIEIRNGIVVQRTQFGLNFNGVTSFDGPNKSYF